MVSTEKLSEKRISVFIGSSAESLPVAREIKSLFNTEKFNVDIWDENIFEKEKSNLHNLMDFSNTYDYGIFVFVEDDKIVRESRGDENKGARPNVIFEFGLFLGRTGIKKTFIVAQESIKIFIDKIFTDLEGINLKYTFDFDYHHKVFKNYDKDKYVNHNYQVEINEDDRIELNKKLKLPIKGIQEEILKMDNELSLGFLPSTALAIGYYENFISRIHYTIKHDLIKNNDYLDLPVQGIKMRLNDTMSYKIYIIIPPKIDQASHDDFKANIENLGFISDSIKTPSRGFNVCFEKDIKMNIMDKNILNIFDFPTTLNSSALSIDLISFDKPEEILTKNDDETLKAKEKIIQVLSEKEIANFKKALEILIKRGEISVGRNNKVVDESMEKHIIILTYQEFKTKFKIV